MRTTRVDEGAWAALCDARGELRATAFKVRMARERCERYGSAEAFKELDDASAHHGESFEATRKAGLAWGCSVGIVEVPA